MILIFIYKFINYLIIQLSQIIHFFKNFSTIIDFFIMIDFSKMIDFFSNINFSTISILNDIDINHFIDNLVVY